MTATPNSRPSIRYPDRTIARADRAMRCAPFRHGLFRLMAQQSVGLTAIAGNLGVENGYTNRPLTELRAESELLWLIQVGLLRREVDGQGLTDSFRVTPLGRQLVSQWDAVEGRRQYQPGWLDHLYNALARWLRFPF